MNARWIQSVYWYRFSDVFYLFIQKNVSGQDTGNIIFRYQYLYPEKYMSITFLNIKICFSWELSLKPPETSEAECFATTMSSDKALWDRVLPKAFSAWLLLLHHMVIGADNPQNSLIACILSIPLRAWKIISIAGGSRCTFLTLSESNPSLCPGQVPSSILSKEIGQLKCTKRVLIQVSPLSCLRLCSRIKNVKVNTELA